MVEEELLTVKGIISFTFDMSQRRCSIRGRADLQPQVWAMEPLLLVQKIIFV